MIETLHPGLYIQEQTIDTPTTGVSTSVAGFVGTAPKGKVGVPQLMKSWNDFIAEYGSYSNDSYLAYAVRGFFANGGKQCYVTRTVHYNVGVKTSALATKTLSDSVPAVVATVNAKSDGAWGNSIAVEVVAGDDTHFGLKVYYTDVLVETYTGLTLDTAEDLVAQSKYIDIVITGTTIPAVMVKTSLASGADGLSGIADADYVGTSGYKNGLYSFDSVKINMLAVPGVTTTTVLQGILDYCDGRGDVFGILDAPKAGTPASTKTFVKTTATLSSVNGAVYYPWIVVTDPIGVGKSPEKTIPPSGHIAGIFASIDNAVGCWRAPAGTDTALTGVKRLEYELSDAEQDTLNPVGINCLRVFDGVGIVVWGARTLSEEGDAFLYVPVRRVTQFVEQTLLHDLAWTAFKPNGETLWASTKAYIDDFLNSLWAKGGLKGDKATDAYFVICDGTNNDTASINAGKMYVDLGLATLKPAEFVVFRLTLIV